MREGELNIYHNLPVRASCPYTREGELLKYETPFRICYSCYSYLGRYAYTSEGELYYLPSSTG